MNKLKSRKRIKIRHVRWNNLFISYCKLPFKKYHLIRCLLCFFVSSIYTRENIVTSFINTLGSMQIISLLKLIPLLYYSKYIMYYTIMLFNHSKRAFKISYNIYLTLFIVGTMKTCYCIPVIFWSTRREINNIFVFSISFRCYKSDLTTIFIFG